MPYADPQKQREAQRDYARRRRKSAPQTVRENHLRSRVSSRKRNRAVIAAFKAVGCSKCSEKDPVALDCHHRPDEEKLFSISKRASWQISVSRIQKELDKCVVLCSNCHRKEHAALRKKR